jgi:hypothetical protein
MPQSKSNNFNIDDYVSSDNDSFVGSPRSNGEGDESLLFRNSGYGFDADRLPGLFDGSEPASLDNRAVYSPTQLSAPSHHGSAYRRGPLNVGRYDDSLHSKYSRLRRGYVLDVDADDWDEDEEEAYEDMPLDFDSIFYPGQDENEVVIQQGLSPHQSQRGFQRSLVDGPQAPTTRHGSEHIQPAQGQAIAAYQPSDDTIEEELEGKVDVATVVRLRKETKARLRSRGLGARAVKSSDTLGRRLKFQASSNL